MEIKDRVTLNTLKTEAVTEHKKMLNDVHTLRQNVVDRMDTSGTALVFAMLGSFLWLAAFAGGTFLIGRKNIAIIAFVGGVLLVLWALVFVDKIMSLNFYSRIRVHLNETDALYYRLKDGQEAIDVRCDEYMNSEKNGWDLTINRAAPINEEINHINTTLANIQSHDKGALQSAKNVFYFIAVGVVELFGGYALFSSAGSLIKSLGSESMRDETARGWCIFGLIVAFIGTEFVAYLLWRVQGHNVTNVTLFAVAAGPLAFFLVMFVGALLWNLLKFALVVVAVLAGIACCVATTSGASE